MRFAAAIKALKELEKGTPRQSAKELADAKRARNKAPSCKTSSFSGDTRVLMADGSANLAEIVANWHTNPPDADQLQQGTDLIRVLHICIDQNVPAMFC